MSFVPKLREGRAQGPEAWLTIVGVGADGAESLAAPALAAIARAEVIMGSARQLALLAHLTQAECVPWPSPFSEGLRQVLARRGRPTCLLASGDPFFYGVGASLAAQVSPREMRVFSQPSSVSLAAARLGWPLQQVDVVSLHGRDLDTLRRYLVHGRRVLALSWDATTPHRVATLLRDCGYGLTRVHVLEALGRSDERARCFLPDELLEANHGKPADSADTSAERRERDESPMQPTFDGLNLLALELSADTADRRLSSHVSLPDEAFEHDGQLTKQEVRAITLAALFPRAGALLWDVGAGAGSIAISWMRSHADCRAIAIERDARRCERIAQNARALGVPALKVVHADAPAGLDTLERPDAIFIGGGGPDVAVFERCWEALVPGGRLVLNAVTLETQALALSLYQRHGGELRRIAIESAAPLGQWTGFRPAMPIVQWRIDKP